MSVRITKLTDLTSQATLAVTTAVVSLTSLVVHNVDRTQREWGGNAGSTNTDACFHTCVPGQQSAASQFLEESLGGLILATHTAAFAHCW